MEEWLAELGLEPVERAEREGVSSWDVVLDGRVRRDVRLTLIHDPTVGVVGWVHYAPPLSDRLRKSYRQLLRWNDELPFAKFAISEDERPVLTAEIPADQLAIDSLGLMVARLLAICDLLYDESVQWLDRRDGRARAHASDAPITQPRDPRPAGAALLDRFAGRLGELTAPSQSGGEPGM
jgi:hypothetical protein